MAQIEDFFLSSNMISSIPEEKYEKMDVLIDSFNAIIRMTDKSLYIVDYYKNKLLYVSTNPLFLCGYSVEEVLKLSHVFYIKHVPLQEQAMLTEINKAGFDFYDKVPTEERFDYTISYNFHLMTEKKEILINHKITPVCLTDDGKIWLAACCVSLPTQNMIGNIEMCKINEATSWKYSLENHCWEKAEKGVTLDERERDILSLSAQGYIMKEIADRLCLSLDTPKQSYLLKITNYSNLL